jgi:predicted phosphoribosyltransferase
VIRNEGIIGQLGMSEEQIARAIAAAQAELAAKERLYGHSAVERPLEGRTVILVDDGAATGATMRAAVAAARARKAAKVAVALPHAAAESAAALAREADELVCLETPEPYIAVGYWYRDFGQVADEEVRRLLKGARTKADGGSDGS